MAEANKRAVYLGTLTKENLFNLPSQGDGRKSRSNIEVRSIADAEKAERDAKTARLKAQRMAKEKK
ncbi:hypothetical protein LGH82_04855 [Mesorhizobium sp. PAMC28654]|uniref:hypothetical protein n=1 Tax=Mesorhizobium sp. PAMC28654 TaxID=2880934 RepID=UPI001D0B0448|nr:hypothetical protein [Mesorhizobium sp. PAMC28654]UDL90666.1 hypothetical protein LGH82_04855 [Mesorhizobium sp. PAMC28654]